MKFSCHLSTFTKPSISTIISILIILSLQYHCITAFDQSDSYLYTILSSGFSTTAMATEETTTPTTPVPDLKGFRQYFLGTTTFNDESQIDKLLSPEVDLIEFWNKTQPFEKIKYPNGLRFNIPAQHLGSLADNIIHAYQKSRDSVANIPKGQHTYNNTLGAMESFERGIQPLYSSLDFVGDVSPIQEVRDASCEQKQKIAAAFIQQNSRADVYESIKAFSQTDEASKLIGEELKQLQDSLRDYRRDGLELIGEDKINFVAIKTKLASLGIKFQQNLGEENTTFKLTKDELNGLSEDQLASFPYDETEKTYTVSLKTTDYLSVMKYCHTPSTRQKLELAYNSRCADENGKILNEMIQLRTQAAKLLGYKSHADYVLDVSMAKSPKVVNDFLTDLNTRLTPLYEQDSAALLTTKKRVYKQLGLPDTDAETVEAYDRAYLTNIIEKEDYAVDQEEVKKYFPLDHVLNVLMELYGTLFGLRFVEDKTVDENIVVHPDVRFFNVYDETGVTKPDELFGQFYLDLFPRQGKYGHAAVFPLVASYTPPNQPRSPPVIGMVCNFQKPTDTKPSLLDSQSVITLFHEFGHLGHGIHSKTQLSQYAGTSTLRDFVETPSQALENMVLTPQFLTKLTKHYQTGEQAPIELIDKIIKADKCQSGSFNKRQLVFGLFDQRIHTSPDNTTLDTNEVYGQVLQEVMGVSPSPGTNFPATFGHIAGGYDSFYFGYMWSLSLAHSVWDKLERDGLTPDAFRRYRSIVLQPGGSTDPNQLIEEFLGGQPTNIPFLKSLGCGDKL